MNYKKYIYEQGLNNKCISIVNNSRLGSSVNIGNNCIIGAGSAVTKDIPKNSLVVGNPGKVI